MSGIYGIFNTDGKPVSSQTLETLKSSLIHRAVDGSTEWKNQQIGLGHLKLVDTTFSALEMQPIHYQHWVLVTDARIDNRRELGEMLNIEASELKTLSDGMLIARAYEKWKEACPDKLIGAFAFVIWDKRNQSLFCAKDHIGARPFFYYYHQNAFVFSSEIQALTKILDRPLKFNEQKFIYYLLGMHWYPGEQEKTFIENIHRLLPGQSLAIDQNKKKIKKTIYWTNQQRSTIKYKNEQEYYDHYKEILSRAVGDRMQTNHSIGVTLSGGLDSSTVASLAALNAMEKGQKIHSVSSIPLAENKEKVVGELSFIKAVQAKYPNISGHFVSGNANPYFGLRETFEQSFVPPNFFFMMDAAICKKFEDKNVRVVLNGFYGDSAASYFGQEVPAHLLRHLQFQKLWQLLSERKKYWKNKTVAHIFYKESLAPNLRHFGKQFKFFNKKHQIEIEESIKYSALPKDIIGKSSIKEAYQRFEHYLGRPNDIYSLIANVGFLYPTEQLILAHHHHKSSVTFPLADRRLLEFTLGLPPEIFLKGHYNRALIRTSMKDIVPKEIENRYDKKPYIPDFYLRILNIDKRVFEEAPKKLAHLVDTDKIKETHLKLKETKNLAGLSASGLRTLGYGIIGSNYLKWIEEQL